jgi:pyruvate/oxaloacetate carboxyltransferase
VASLLNVLNAPSLSPLAAAHVHESVQKIRGYYGKTPTAMGKFIVHTIEQFKANPIDWKPMDTPKIPDGAPIGMDCLD